MAIRIFTIAIAAILLLAFLWLYSIFGLPVLLVGMILTLLAGFIGIEGMKRDDAQKKKWK